MLTKAVIVVTGLLMAQAGTAPAQLPHPSPVGSTPTACLAEVGDFSAARQKEVAPPSSTNPPAARNQQLVAIRQAVVAMAKDCVAKFDVKTVPAGELVPLARLYQSASDNAGALKPIERALEIKTGSGQDRAQLLAVAMQVVQGITVPNGRDGRQAQMYPKLETFVDELDATAAATFEQRFDAHSRMLGSYRGDDIDAGIIKHATWILNAAKTFTSEQHAKYGQTLVAAHVDMSQAWAGQGMTDKALDLLRSGKTALADVPRSAEEFTPEIVRLELVGKPAASITAPRWLNAPAELRSYSFPGKVTLMEFTAHWCGPCRESYPGINRLRAEYGPKGFQVVMVTKYWGYYSSPEKGLERPLAPEVELERDKTYFAEHQLNVPVAIQDATADWDSDPNFSAYHVTGIPQIQVIDKKGVVRRILVGYDNANEPRLAELIKQLLAEK
jgi:thiol-disulfide isomerase/thioredoxin